MVDESIEGGERSAKGVNVALQVVAAFGLGAVALGAMWGLGVFRKPTDAAGAGRPAGCQARKPSDAAEYPALCAALNQPDLPVLLGAPGEHVILAQSAGSTFTYPNGSTESDAAAEVQLGTYNVRLTDNQNISVKALAAVTDSVQPTTVLGHAALTYADRTMEITFGGDQAGGTRAGGIARHLVVAKSAKDGGGSFELAVWRQDGTTPDAASLLRIAQEVLPAAPGWVGGT
ncbi:DUF6215 domain-containing protein [Streptacidiphilus neutrinimicus]|uniref:DUF6215 domain-containing protein n=1 Tax=Streptacidiphilus neutrinimicus TaxID=105420 RepID=UPI0005AA6673|nr:DUF6215 domain-containing protein [Streptacidiphilus neutrinimicus]